MFRTAIVALIPLAIYCRVDGNEPSEYVFYDLGYLESPNDSITGWAMNDSGIVVGTDLAQHADEWLGTAFKWSNGRFEDLAGVHQDYYFSAATGISNSGLVGGVAACVCYPECEPCGDFHAVIWREGELTLFPIPVECWDHDFTDLMSPNGRYFVGQCESIDNNGTIYGVLYDTLELTATIVAPPGGYPPNVEGFVDDVNDQGVVVGAFVSNDDDAEPFTTTKEFMWQNGSVTLIPSLLGVGDANPNNINNKGTVSGPANFEDAPSTAFMYINGEMFDVGGWSTWGLNDRNVAVGEGFVGSLLHPYRYTLTQSVDLLPYFPAEYLNGTAIDINNYGWIAGQTSFHVDGFQHLWLMVPVYSNGDYDGDEDVDLQDFGKFQECFAAEAYQGPEGGLHVGCSVFDFDDDIDLDLTDYAAFQAALTGPTAPDLNPTGPG